MGIKGLILPVALLGAGAGGGVAAGLALTGEPEAPVGETLTCVMGPDGALVALEDGAAGADHAAPAESHAPPDAHAAEEAGHGAEDVGGHGDGTGHDYVRLANQFVVPLLDRGAVEGLVLMSLSVEVPEGEEEALRQVEPKLRDAFLATLFDHANAGGFRGDFTSSETLATLRRGLQAAADTATGGLVSEVLIVEMVRQDG